jgi:hypothetical protein
MTSVLFGSISLSGVVSGVDVQHMTVKMKHVMRHLGQTVSDWATCG